MLIELISLDITVKALVIHKACKVPLFKGVNCAYVVLVMKKNTNLYILSALLHTFSGNSFHGVLLCRVYSGLEVVFTFVANNGGIRDGDV